jgi:IclR family transcriptional regulator, pca regulon regulatory protein
MPRGESAMPEEKDRNYVVALARGLAVLSAFSQQKEQLTLAEIAKLVDLSRATVRRSLITLQSLGYIDSDGKYFQVAPKVLGLAQAYLLSSPLPRVVQPFLERLSETLGESCTVSILQGDEVIYVARSSRRRASALLRDVGAHLPAYCTAMGRILLAALSDKELDAFFKRVKMIQQTRFTVVNAAKLRKIIATVREREFCISDQEFEIDLRTIAVPLRNATGRTIAALTVTTRASETPKQRLLDEFLPILRATAAEMRPLLVG